MVQEQKTDSAEQMLAELRARIDKLDVQMMSSLEERISVSQSISAAKSPGSAVYRPGREAELMRRLVSEFPAVPQRLILSVWRVIMSSSIAMQKPDFAIASTADGLMAATGLAAGQLHLLPVCSDAHEAVSLLSSAQADIVVISESELSLIASEMGRDRKAVVIGSYPFSVTDENSSGGFVIGRDCADRSSSDQVFTYHPETKEIVSTMLYGYEGSLADDSDDAICIGYRASSAG